jgi:hypothetical protein
MGNSYQNLTLRIGDRAAVATACEGIGVGAYVTPSRGGYTVVFPERGDAWGNPEEIGDVAGSLAQVLKCPALTVGVFDEDVTLVSMWRGLERTFFYASSDGVDGSIAELCGTMGRRWALPLVATVLYMPRPIPYLFETMRHSHLAGALGLPSWAVGLGYRYIHRNGEAPPGLAFEDLLRV